MPHTNTCLIQTHTTYRRIQVTHPRCIKFWTLRHHKTNVSRVCRIFRRISRRTKVCGREKKTRPNYGRYIPDIHRCIHYNIHTPTQYALQYTLQYTQTQYILHTVHKLHTTYCTYTTYYILHTVYSYDQVCNKLAAFLFQVCLSGNVLRNFQICNPRLRMEKKILSAIDHTCDRIRRSGNARFARHNFTIVD